VHLVGDLFELLNILCFFTNLGHFSFVLFTYTDFVVTFTTSRFLKNQVFQDDSPYHWAVVPGVWKAIRFFAFVGNNRPATQCHSLEHLHL